MLDDTSLVFVEVRCRSENSLVDALLTVDSRKQRKLASAAALFLALHPAYANSVCRFDVIGIDRSGDSKASIRWLRDAFRPGG